MSAAHPIIAITGSSGAGTTSVSKTFEQIFRREGVSAAFVEGDAFHRYPFIARFVPTADESMLVIRFANPRGIDFPYLLSMLRDSFMSRPNTIVAPGGKMDLAMQLVFTPMIWRLMDQKRRATAGSPRERERSDHR